MRVNMYHEPFFDEMHKLACRHCNAKSSFSFDQKKMRSYSSILVNGGEQDFDLELRKIESKNNVLNEISMFCEKCMSISVVSFEYYQRKNSAVKNILLDQVYKTETEYYVSLIRQSQNYEM